MQQSLARRRVAALDHLAHLGLQQRQVIVAQRLALLWLLSHQLLLPGLQAAQPLGQLADPGRAGRLWHRALLEGAEVAIERLAGTAQVAVDPLQLCQPLRLLGVDLCEGFGDRLADQRLLVEHGEELFEDRLLQLVCRQPVGFTHFLSVALAREAHVVAVAPTVAVCGGAEVLLAATRALDQAGEQVFGLVGPT